MESQNLPLVSIGVPVFNGENGLSVALDSLLDQDYPNLEIIISDNASTDGTPEICKKYVEKDSRVKYSRSDVNHGGIWNYNRVFQFSTGKYFMLAAHDDQREKSFVSACVKKMEQCPEAALCHSQTAIFIEGCKELICLTHLDSFEGIKGLVARYRETLKNFPATACYGLYRTSLMRKTGLFQKLLATDLAFIQELSIYGEFVQVPEVLFNYFSREKWNTVHQDYQFMFRKEKKPWWYWPFVVLFNNQWKRVNSARIPFSVKIRLWAELIRHLVRHVALKVLIKMAGKLCPDRFKVKLGITIYRRWIMGPNVQPKCDHLYLERMIKPQLGWWK